MPIYSFRNINTGEEFEHVLKISEYDDFVKSNPSLDRIIKAIRLVSARGDIKPDNGFRDVLKRIKKASGKNNTIETF